MASFRKKYAEEPPVTTAPTGAAKLPEPVEPKAAEPLVVKNPDPVETAKKDAIALQLRLKEMERAERLQQEAVQQQPHVAELQQEQQPQAPEMPVHISKWLAEHPEYMNPNDHVAQAEIYTATLKCNRDGKNWDQPDFIPTLERHLGLRREQQRPQPPPQPPQPPAPPPPAPRYEAPPRQQRSPVPMSAPPSREAPSMSTGRPQSFRAPLTADELEIARVSGITPERYAQEKEKMLRMKAAGQLDDRR